MKYAMFDGHYTENPWFNINVDHATDNFIFSKGGKRYLDLRSGLWNTSLGYMPELYKKVSDEFTKLMNKRIPYIDMHSFYNPLYEETAENILNLLDQNFQKVIYTNTGSECTELSLKLANSLKHKSDKNRILAFSSSYHGTFFGGMSVSGLDQELNKVFNPKYGLVEFIDFPKNSDEESHLLDWLEGNADQYDVMMIEPILSSAGIYATSSNFMDSMLSILKKNNVISIFDEVATGFYKTGFKFYFEQFNNRPDIINLSKSINNGITPFGCVCISEELANQFSHRNVNLNHFSTQNGNLLGYVAAKVTTQYYLEHAETIQKKVNQIENSIKIIFSEKQVNYRNIGTMVALPIDHIDPLELARELKEIGILVYFFSNHNEQGISLFPQYSISTKLLNQSLNLIAKKVSLYQK